MPVFYCYQLSCRKVQIQISLADAVPGSTVYCRAKKCSLLRFIPGNVAALNEVELHSQVSGYITGIFFKEGSQVVKGQKLYEIDRRKYQAALEQAKANVKYR